MKKKKIFSLIVTVALMTSLMAGCGSNTNSTNSTSSDSLSDKSPITITFYDTDGSAANSKFSDPIAKEITKETGVTLKFEYPVAGQDRIPLMMASGQYPDIVYGKGDTDKLISAGALIPLDNYLKDTPNIKKLFGSYLNRLKYSSTDPHVYALGCYGVAPQGTPNWGDTGLFQIQNAVLKDQSYPKIKTLDDYEAAIKAYVAKYPTINGQKTIGLSLDDDGWVWVCSLGDPASEALGLPDNGEWKVDPKTDKAEYKFLDPNMKTYFKWLNKMNAEGLLDPDCFTQKSDQYKAKIASGRVLAVTDASWDYGTATTALTTSNQADRTFIALPATIDSKIKDAETTDQGYGASAGIEITKSCKNPKRVMEFLNWMASDKAQVLFNWGIEGKDYTVVNGKRVQTAWAKAQSKSDPNWGADSGIGLYTYPFPQYGDGVKDPSGDYYTMATKQSNADNYNTAIKATLAAYGATLQRDLYPASSNFPMPISGPGWMVSIPTDSSITIPYNKAEAISQKELPQVVLASPANFDTAWANFQSDLQATGVQDVGKEWTKLGLAKAKLFGNIK